MRYAQKDLKMGDGVECSGTTSVTDTPCPFIDACDKHAVVISYGDRITMVPTNPYEMLKPLIPEA